MAHAAHLWRWAVWAIKTRPKGAVPRGGPKCWHSQHMAQHPRPKLSRTYNKCLRMFPDGLVGWSRDTLDAYVLVLGANVCLPLLLPTTPLPPLNLAIKTWP